jgi:hypothetical protein
VITIKTYYIKKVDKPIPIIGNIKQIKLESDNCEIYLNLEKEKNIKKVINKMKKNDINNVVLEKELHKNKTFINYMKAYEINIFDGRWIIKYLSCELIEYVVKKKNVKKEETEIAIAVNEITDLAIETIQKLARQYKKTTIVTNNINKLRKIEKDIYEKEGILIIISNNQKKSFVRSNIIINMDFNYDVFNKYKINENAVIINLEGDMKIESKRFNGININDYEIEIENEEIIFRENMLCFSNKDLLEAKLYTRDTFKNIREKIEKSKIHIKEVYGINGKIERFY